jgi:hypothetical protein
MRELRNKHKIFCRQRNEGKEMGNQDVVERSKALRWSLPRQSEKI